LFGYIVNEERRVIPTTIVTAIDKTLAVEIGHGMILNGRSATVRLFRPSHRVHIDTVLLLDC
jgi:hypothetical protein